VTQTPAAVAGDFQRLGPAEKRALLARILREKAGAPSIHPLSYGQKALYVLHLVAPQSPAYNMGLAMRIRTPTVDRSALRVACQRLLDRHPSLRSRLVIRDGKPMQEIDAYQQVQLDERHFPQVELDQIRTVLRTELEQPFDLAHGPVFRVIVISRSERDHVLFLCVHHTVCDGWSLWLLLDELRLLYIAIATGARDPLLPLPAIYGDFVEWQRTMLAGQEGERLATYWMRQLAGAPAVLELPTDRPRPPAQTFNGSSCRFAVSADLLRRLKEAARQSETTLFMTVLATFQVLLHRYTNQDDFLIGTTTTGRSRPEFAGVVGYFTNPVAVRANLSGDPTFRELQQRVKGVMAQAIAHQDYPFPLVVQRMQPVRDPSRSPLFQVFFNWQKPIRLAKAEERTAFELFDVGGREGVFDLSLEVGESPDALLCTFRYNTDLFRPDSIEQMAARFHDLLRQAAFASDERVSSLRIMSFAEEHKIITEWNDTAKAYPTNLCLHHLIEAQAARNPDAPALRFGNLHRSYGELDRNANARAHHLAALGVKPEMLVAICLPPSIEQIEAILAVLKSGGAYLPIDANDPPDRLAQLLADAKPHLVLTNKAIAEKFTDCASTIVCLEEQRIDLAPAAITVPHTRVGPCNLAYALYTSGTTGAPKAALVEHRNIVNYTLAISERLGLEKVARFGLLQPLTWDGGTGSLFAALSCGGEVHLILPELSCDQHALAAYLDLHDVRYLKITPSHLCALETVGETSLPIGCLMLGGEASNFIWFQGIRSRNPSCQVFNHYGPTEATIGALVYSADCRAAPTTPVTPLGRPLANIQAYVLNHRLQPSPVGLVGELYLGGAGVGRGYLNRPALTALRFIPNIFRAGTGARLYRTGDLARYLPDGNIEFLGRTDTQVKHHGIRVELSEIEAVLNEHADVREAAVMLRKDQGARGRLVAYVVPRQKASALPQSLRHYASSKLPAYMVPAAFVMLDRLPLTSRGKLNRAALPLPGQASDAAAPINPPRGRTERLIAKVWEDVLDRRPISIDDNFFDAGGDSLLVIVIHARLQDQLRRKIEFISLFEHPTIRLLAARLDGAEDEVSGRSRGLARAESRRAVAVPAQHRRAKRFDSRQPSEGSTS
jgi:amino acid adenylation domain-containing protein